MPRLPVLNGFANPNQFVRGGPPMATTVIDGATQLHPQQLFTKFPPTKLYELHMQEANVRLHPDYPPTPPRSGASTAGSPGHSFVPITASRPWSGILRSAVGQVPAVDGFGIAEITTHLHNAHTPFESDGNPVVGAPS